ncbi:hypothetical protein ACTXT7_005079 [Hymenolepis weldensis]
MVRGWGKSPNSKLAFQVDFPISTGASTAEEFANLNATDKRGFTPLHMAARWDHQIFLCTLLDTIPELPVCFSQFSSATLFTTYSPLCKASAIGDRGEMFLQGVSTREDCLLTLDLARYMPKNAESSMDFDEAAQSRSLLLCGLAAKFPREIQLASSALVMALRERLVNASDKGECKAFMLAAEKFHTSVVKLLCSQSCFRLRSFDAHIVLRVYFVCKQDKTALHRSPALGNNRGRQNASLGKSRLLEFQDHLRENVPLIYYRLELF